MKFFKLFLVDECSGRKNYEFVNLLRSKMFFVLTFWSILLVEKQFGKYCSLWYFSLESFSSAKNVLSNFLSVRDFFLLMRVCEFVFVCVSYVCLYLCVYASGCLVMCVYECVSVRECVCVRIFSFLIFGWLLFGQKIIVIFCEYLCE